jgi:hypothetical protein
MKEMIFKDYTGENPRKREVSVEERTDWTNPQKGTLKNASIMKKKTCKYFVEKVFRSEDPEKLKSWINEEKSHGVRKDRYLLRFHDAKTGETKIICKVIGDIYVIKNSEVYKIVFFNYIKVHIGCPGDKPDSLERRKSNGY